VGGQVRRLDHEDHRHHGRARCRRAALRGGERECASLFPSRVRCAPQGAIVFTTILNAAFLDGPFTLPIVAGAVVVMVSVCNYNDRGDPES